MPEATTLTNTSTRAGDVPKMIQALALGVLVRYPTLNDPFGGGEYLVGRTAVTLSRLGFAVRFETLDEPDWEKLRLSDPDLGAFNPGDVKHRIRAMSHSGHRLLDGVANTLIRIIWGGKSSRATVTEKSEVSIDFDGNYEADLHYVFTPPSVLGSGGDLRWISEAAFGRRQRFRNLRSGVSVYLSKFTQESFGRFGFDGEVLHPPVLVDTSFLKNPRAAVAAKDQRLVATVSRIHPFKRLDSLLEAARARPELRFIVVGSIVDSDYYRALRRKAPNNVAFIPNATVSQKTSVLRSARFYLHCAADEPFGISVVEALSWGCVPIVHRSGGPWFDILNKGELGYGYDGIEELSQTLEQLGINSTASEQESLRCVRRASDFSEEMFERRLAGIMNRLIPGPRRGGSA